MRACPVPVVQAAVSAVACSTAAVAEAPAPTAL